jgi:polyisoprenoid-binding protein YceI
MMRRKCRIGLAVAAALFALPLAAQTRAMDSERSFFTVRVFKAGLFSALGHEHDVRAPLSEGTVQEGEAASVQLRVDARQLKVVDPDRPEKERAEVQETMLGPNVLDSGRFPEIRFRSTAVEKTGAEHWQVRGELVLHGQTRPVVVDVARDKGRYRGAATLKQTDFGITPVRVGGGTVKVKDEVRVEFEISLKE